MRLLGQVLATEEVLAELQCRRQREAGVQVQVQRALPPALAVHVKVVDARSEELELVVASGAAAALVRQRASDLLRKLAGEGWKFTGIRVRVQARQADGRPPKTSTKQLDEAAGTTLETLASRLGESPLAAALRRLARHARHRAGSGDHHQALERVKDQDAEQ
jgi:hypothetical protein